MKNRDIDLSNWKNVKISLRKKTTWFLLSKKRKKEIAQSIKLGMSKPEVKEKLSILNRRPRRAMSESHKTKISRALRGKLPPNMRYSNNGYGHFKNGEYDINGRVIYFRSKWEAEIALYLDFLKKHGEVKEWYYEAQTFVFDKIRHGTTRYLPDFKVINKDDSVEFWEVKGYWDSRSRTKIKRMRKYYPEVKLVLIEGDFIKDLRRKLDIDNLLKDV